MARTNFEWLKSLSVEDFVTTIFKNKCQMCIHKLDDCNYFNYNCEESVKEWLNRTNNFTEDNIDWSKVPTDTLVYVSNDPEGDWFPRHFYNYHQGFEHPYSTFLNGKDLFTNGDDPNIERWKYARLARNEDREKYRQSIDMI